MCVAIVKPAGFEIDKEILLRCFRNNSDGCGIAYIEHGRGKKNKMMLYRSLGFKNFLKQLRKLERKFPKFPMLIHFRAKSKGEVSLANCHPFSIDENHAFVHNGTIFKVDDDPNGKKSDTVMFNETIMKKLPAGWFGNPVIQELVEDYIGSSKLAMLNVKGETQIFNEEKGDTSKDGVWFSNTQWRIVTGSHNSQTQKDWQKNWQDYEDPYDYSAHNRKEVGHDEHTDVSKWCQKNKAYHGQNRWDVGARLYQKYDWYKLEWLRLADWKEKYLSDADDSDAEEATVVDTTSADDAPKVYENIYELRSTEISELAEELGIPHTETDFQLELTDSAGSSDLIDFQRCSFCWQPDYASYIRDVNIDGEDFTLCDECEHNMKEHGMLPKDEE